MIENDWSLLETREDPHTTRHFVGLSRFKGSVRVGDPCGGETLDRPVLVSHP